jgi:2-C-methyl-D-erythritol 2,4-cyclodiphosphate synthase
MLHALCDALLGAAALGDIGKHFPDTDPEFKGADSRVLLRYVYDIVQKKGYSLVNTDKAIAFFLFYIVDITQQNPTISAFKLRVGIRKMFSDIT